MDLQYRTTRNLRVYFDLVDQVLVKHQSIFGQTHIAIFLEYSNCILYLENTWLNPCMSCIELQQDYQHYAPSCACRHQRQYWVFHLALLCT